MYWVRQLQRHGYQCPVRPTSIGRHGHGPTRLHLLFLAVLPDIILHKECSGPSSSVSVLLAKVETSLGQKRGLHIRLMSS